MVQDETEPALVSRKRRRSPAPSPQPADMDDGTQASTSNTEAMQRAPKRLRRSHEIPAYDAPVRASGLAHSNPLNRRVLMKAAKKARRAERARVGGSMEIDDIQLDNTFLVGAEAGFGS